jgi:hypothetical protein
MTASVGDTMNARPVEPKPPQPLHTNDTSRFPALRERHGISLVVATDRARERDGLRAEGNEPNAEFRNVPADSDDGPSSATAATNQQPFVIRP